MTESAEKWVPLSLTLVEYPEGDHFGKLLALFSLSPFAILAGFAALILFRRDLHTITFFIGTATNELLNFILKHTICEARPMARSSLYTEYGMPSSHSQFMWFFALYCALFILIRLHHMNNSSALESFWKIGLVCSCILLAIIVSFGRVYLNYHSWKQVLVGSAVGVAFAIFWFAMTHLVFSPLFPTIVTWKISELLLIRDTTLIPNIMWFEYTNTRQEARARGRKLVTMKSQ
ncbi:dolichyldiphosphatase 1-like [Cloeon dipterum]|uniref:dolichyldiphosphatase 1-like n=1 Tax=Cloeon dipterum TaxID=197152 RepID=UPI0032205DDB